MLFGRTKELEFLTDRLGRDRPVVVGEAGIGKTALLRSGVERAGRRAREGGGLATLAYLPLARALGNKSLEGDAPHVANLVAKALEPGDVLVLDDVHWADRATLDVLTLLPGRVCVLAAVRRGDPGSRSALSALADSSFELLPVEPLRGRGGRPRAAAALTEAHQPVEARRILERVSTDDPLVVAERAALAWRIAYALHERPEVLSACIDEGLAAARGSGTQIEVRLCILDARTAGAKSDYDAWRAKAELALELAQERAVDEGLAHAVLGAALSARAENGWEEHLSRGIELCRRDGDVAHEFTATNTLVYARYLVGRVPQALDAAAEAAERARRLRLRGWERRFIVWSIALNWALGNARGAATIAEEMLAERLPEGDLDVLEPFACQAMIDLGRMDDAGAIAERLRERAVPDFRSLGEALWVQADLELHSGRAREGLAAAEEYRERFAAIEVEETARFVELTAAWARFDLGLEQVPPVFTQQHRLTAGSSAELEGLEALARGDASGAAGRFRAAALQWEGRNARCELRALWAEGEALRRSGAEEARPQLEAVEARASELAFAPLLARIRRSLRMTGAQRSAPRASGEELSEREREVLALVAHGHSNAEIARRLGLSRATVAEHVSSAATKLGARSRARAAALAAHS